MNRWMWTLICFLMLPIILPAAPAKDDQAEAQAILDKAIKALGGQEKLAKLTSFVETAKCKSFPPDATPTEYSRTISCRFPDLWCRQTETHERKGTRYVLNGEQGWFYVEDDLYEFTKEQVERRREIWRDELIVWQFLFFKDTNYKLSPLGASKVGDQAAVGVKASRKRVPDLKLYFDRDTGLLLKREREEAEPTPPGEKPPPPIIEEILYENYKEVGGIKYPTKTTALINKEKISEGEITEFKIVERFDEKTFAKPEKK